MVTILFALVSLLSVRFRSRASLELELVASRHQVIVLRRQRPHRLRLLSADRLLWVWVALPSAAAGPRNLGTRQTGDCGQMVSQRLSDLLAMAVTLPRTAQDERRNTRPDPSNERRQPAHLAFTANCSSSASRLDRPALEGIRLGARKLPVVAQKSEMSKLSIALPARACGGAERGRR